MILSCDWLLSCYVCDGPNNICAHGELGTSQVNTVLPSILSSDWLITSILSQACLADEKYCIKELSGDASNR